MGLKDLWLETLKKCKKALDGDMKSFMTTEISKDIVSKIKDLNTQIKEKIIKNNKIFFMKNYIENKEDFDNFIINLFNENIRQFLEKNVIKEESIELFRHELLLSMEKYKNYYQRITKELIENVIKEKAHVLLNLQVEVEQESRQNICIENKRNF